MKTPRIGSKWEHWKSANVYQVIDVGRDASKHGDGIVIWYENVDDPGKRYCRPLKEWHEVLQPGHATNSRRFTEIKEVEHRGIISKLFGSKSRTLHNQSVRRRF